MFKALNIHTGEEVVILDAQWNERIPELRRLDHQDLLVCQACQQPVRVRKPHRRRRHFAHKHLENCPYLRESPHLLEARAALYEWLVGQFGRERVTLEKKLEIPKLPRHVDCWVNAGANRTALAYWIIDLRMLPRLREALQEGLTISGAQVNIIFLASMLHEDEAGLERAFLTTTERAFMQETVFDQTYKGGHAAPGKSLHYLDAENGTLTTLRGMQVHHLPQLYAGYKKSTPLSQVRADPGTGELIHPGEVDRLQRVEKAKKRREDHLIRYADKIAQALASQSPASRRQELESRQALADRQRALENQTDLRRDPFAREGTCRICGTKTTDWVVFYGATNECICRNCNEKGLKAN
jgi:hypothetical protein